MRDLQDEDLIQRLISNGFAYSMFSGFTAIPAENGQFRYIPRYEAFGISTQYFLYDRDWQNCTIMLATSNEELKKRMADAQKQGNR